MRLSLVCDGNSRELDYNILNEHIAVISTEPLGFQEGLCNSHVLDMGVGHRYPALADQIR